MNMLLKTKFKNGLLKKVNENDIVLDINNIRINGINKGCSGTITHKKTGVKIYINTEGIKYIGEPRKLLYRFESCSCCKNKKELWINHKLPTNNMFTTENDFINKVVSFLNALDKLK